MQGVWGLPDSKVGGTERRAERRRSHVKKVLVDEADFYKIRPARSVGSWLRGEGQRYGIATALFYL